MKNILIKDWEDFIDLNFEGKIYNQTINEVKATLKDWLDDNGELLLAENGEDYREVFAKDYGDYFTERFGEIYLKNVLLEELTIEEDHEADREPFYKENNK